MKPRLPIAEVLGGLTIASLGEGVTALEVVCIIKALDKDGDDAWFVRCTDGTSDIEVMGALLLELDRRRYHKAKAFFDQDE